MGHKMSGGGTIIGDDADFGLNFLIILLSSIYEDEAALCILESFRKDGIYVGYNKKGGGGINNNKESGNETYGIGFSIAKITPMLSIRIG